MHRDNAIPIPSWYDNPTDDCLKRLPPLLEELSKVRDVRDYIPDLKIGDFLTKYSIQRRETYSYESYSKGGNKAIGLYSNIYYKDY